MPDGSTRSSLSKPKVISQPTGIPVASAVTMPLDWSAARIAMEARIMEAMIFLLHRADAVGYILFLVNHKDVGLGKGKLQGG